MQESQISGVIEHIIFSNETNGYSVLQVAVEDTQARITVAGPSSCRKIGASIRAWGSYTTHPKYGKQFNARSIIESQPLTTNGIERYLASGHIKGVGPSTAKLIVARFGEKALEIVRSDPNRIARIKGVGKHKAKLLFEAFAERKEVEEIMQVLIAHGVSPLLSEKIYKRFGNKTTEVVKKDPYLLAYEMKGVGFLTADEIAKSFGLTQESPERLRAGILYALEKGTDDGHCYLTEEMLIERSRFLLGISEEVDLTDAINWCIKEERVKKYNEVYYLAHLERAETVVADFINARFDKLSKATLPVTLIDRAISDAEKALNVSFSSEQQQALIDLPYYKLMVITGGPGCGKTTLIRALVTLFDAAGKSLLLAAPTGRAAQRMASVCDRNASTIHRMLKFDPMTGLFTYGTNQPLNADAIIVDEASMIDIQLAASLLQAIGKDTTLILVGDKDQLPSVGPGRVFAELVGADKVKTTFLSKIFRRGELSSINDIAHTINAGYPPSIPEPDGVVKSDAYLIPKTELEDIAKTVETLVAEQLPKKFGFGPNEIMVLTPTNRGPVGTQSLNERLQLRLNPIREADIGREISINNITFRIGDRVCQRVNNYNIDETGVFNGDIGTITDISPKDRRITVELWDGRILNYSPTEIMQLALAYALTVHRAQGSESPCVVLVLHDSHYVLLEKQLVYTAITRAKKLLVIVGSKRALFLASKRAHASKRLSGLGFRIR